jgi:4-alpha-glucanotransferase
MKIPRTSGILLHPSSLPGPFGIGDIGPGALRFVDWLADAGQGIWQVLPLGPTGYGDSPYAPYSSFAGNELLLSPELLVRDGLLLPEEIDAARRPATNRVEYGTVINDKKALLRLAAGRAALDARFTERLAAFRKRNAAWLDDYTLFVDIKEEFDTLAAATGIVNSAWNEFWPEPLAQRSPEALAERRERRAGHLALIEAGQYLFRTQWDELRSAALAKGIRIMGDLPIFVAMDSADSWAHPELFALDASGHPREVAGVPPDYFAADGQLWGNPLYEWKKHSADGFAWWISRIESALSLYDYVRIDHFRGLAACWSVLAGSSNARNGVWKPAPGMELLAALEQRLGSDLPIVAEDLGFITDDVRSLRDHFGLPGMRILQFGFDSRESGRGLDPANPFLPHNYRHDCVAYTGTHDNDTLAGWLAQASAGEKAFLAEYLGYLPADTVRALIREAMKSAAGLVIVPAQDVLGLGTGARMNEPGTIGGNWTWRLEASELSQEHASWLRGMSTIYARLPQGGADQGASRRT